MRLIHSALLLALLPVGCRTSQMAARSDAPTGVVTGIVVDSSTGEPLPGVRAVIEGTLLGGTSNVNGEYTIEDVPLGSHVVQLTFIGYISADDLPIFVKAKDDTVRLHTALEEQLSPLGITAQVPHDPTSDAYHERLRAALQANPAAIALTIRGMQFRPGQVRIWPEVINRSRDTVFVPNTRGFFGHYEVELLDRAGQSIRHAHDNAPCLYFCKNPPYHAADILKVAPDSTMPLHPFTLELLQPTNVSGPITAVVRYVFDIQEPVCLWGLGGFPTRGNHAQVEAWKQFHANRLATYYRWIFRSQLQSRPLTLTTKPYVTRAAQNDQQ